ncbi:MAG: hypothetical protein HDS75_01915 [Bacteroidales bacterium]|nr:hypothetical protein [Bacteroidales bacterium]MDE6801345.1 hypothetical protein [Muribaculaceae bacterium]
MSEPSSSSRPLWVTIVALLALAPLALFPLLLRHVEPGMMIFVKLYVPYALFTAILAWVCWPRRRDMFWILIILLLLSHVAIWLPTLTGVSVNP